MMNSEIERLNNKLATEFGYFDGVRPNWRIVYSHDQLEKRKTKYTPEGLELLHEVVVEVPKYRQWIHNKYVLERLLPVPDGVETDLVDKTSYEPVWVFQDKHGNALPPRWEPTKIVIETVYAVAANAVGVKYKDPLKSKYYKEEHTEELKQLQEELFGNETDVGDALAQKDAIVVPSNYEVH